MDGSIVSMNAFSKLFAWSRHSYVVRSLRLCLAQEFYEGSKYVNRV